MARPDRDPVAIKKLGHVVRMNSVHDEADNRPFELGLRSQDRQPLDPPKNLMRAMEQQSLVTRLAFQVE